MYSVGRREWDPLQVTSTVRHPSHQSSLDPKHRDEAHAIGSVAPALHVLPTLAIKLITNPDATFVPEFQPDSTEMQATADMTDMADPEHMEGFSQIDF